MNVCIVIAGEEWAGSAENRELLNLFASLLAFEDRPSISLCYLVHVRVPPLHVCIIHEKKTLICNHFMTRITSKEAKVPQVLKNTYMFV